jgi:predicted esterase
VEYYLYVPKNYSPDREWPLFVGLHGSGSSGLECWNLWQAYAKREDFLLLCPSIPGEVGGYYQDVGERTVWSAVGQVRQDYRVSSRLFLAGFSAGAYFIQGFALHYPQSVSGLAILSTGYFVPGLQTRVPILVAIGGSDHPDSIRANQQLVSSLTENGFDVQYKIFPGVGHEVNNDAKSLTIELFRKTIGK